MSVSVTERDVSQTGGEKNRNREYTILGTADFDEAKAALSAYAPLAWGDLVRTDVQVRPLKVDTENPDSSRWTGEAVYGETQEQEQTSTLEAGQMVVRFSTKGGSQHITASKQVVGAYGGAAVPGDTKNLIGVSPKGVEGADIGIATFDFTVRAAFLDSDAYPDLTEIYNLGWHTNEEPFSVTDSQTGLTIAVNAEECLFRGAENGADRTDGALEIVYDFAAAPNEVAITIGDIAGIEKKGHELLDVWYRPYEIPGLKVIGQKAIAVFVHRVYDKGDFTDLGLDHVNGHTQEEWWESP